MSPKLIRRTRRVVGLIAIAALAIPVVFALATRLAPLTGRELFTITGGSMGLAVPLGSMITVTRIDPVTFATGDIVTIRADSGVVITHRVTRVIARPDGRYFELKGDANADPDATLVPSRAIVGRVAEVVPLAGYVRSFLATVAGIVAILALVGALLTTYALLGMLAPSARPRGATTGVDAIRP